MSQINAKNFQFGIEQQNNYNIVMEQYYQNIRETEKYWDIDQQKALKIQSFFKMWKLNKEYKKKKSCAIKIQKNIKQFLSSVYYAKLRENQINNRNIEYFSSQATIIQRHFRGFHTRKYVHDFFARKQFLHLLQNKNETFLQDLKDTSEQERIEEDRRQEAIARSEFNELAKNLHHLSSTNQIPGVYNPPYAQQKKTAFNIEVEMHLQATFKANYKWKPPTKDEISKHSLRPQKAGTLKPLTKRPSSGRQNNTQQNLTGSLNKSIATKKKLSQASMQAVQ